MQLKLNDIKELFQEAIILGQMLEADKTLHTQGALLYTVTASHCERVWREATA